VNYLVLTRAATASTNAAAKRICWAVDHGLNEKFGANEPKSFHEMPASIGKG